MSQMTDKEKIRKEVERLMVELTQEKKKGYSSDVDDACILELQNVLTYIDSLQEEKKPIREYVSPEDSTLGKLYKEAMEELEEKIALYEKNHKKSVSDDLEEVSRNYADNEEYGDDVYYAIKAAFKGGAQWQKEQVITKACEWLSKVSIEDMHYRYNDFDTSEGWYKFIEDFKNYMKGE